MFVTCTYLPVVRFCRIAIDPIDQVKTPVRPHAEDVEERECLALHHMAYIVSETDRPFKLPLSGLSLDSHSTSWPKTHA
jgi:hypothetical protein